MLILTFLPFLISSIVADAELDSTRIGSYYTNYPISRSGSGSNTVEVRIGTPGAAAQLTLFASDTCSCSVGPTFTPGRSSSWASIGESQVNIIVYPQMPEDTLTLTSNLGTDIVLDARGQDQVLYPVASVDKVESGRDGQGGGLGQAVSLATAGFYGLGINQQNRQQSIVANMLNADNYPPNQPITNSFFIGFDIDAYNNQAGSKVGNMHWGAAPQGKWVGDFNWIETNRTVGGSWGMSIENMRMGGNVVDTTSLYASIDPGFDGIFLPGRVAETLFTGIQGARRDMVDPRRWTIPCNYIHSLSITIQSATYNINPTQLVQPRSGTTCYSQVQAWTNGSVAEEQGEIRLGTSFMSGVYSAIYYTRNQQFVALAGKPGSVNDFNVAAPQGGGSPNLRLAGILIGTLFGSLLILFVICYSRNRGSVQSIWARGSRRIQRAQLNAVVRGSTIPPPMMGPMGPAMASGLGGPGLMGMMAQGMMRPGMVGPGVIGTGMMAPGMMGPHLGMAGMPRMGQAMQPGMVGVNPALMGPTGGYNGVYQSARQLPVNPVETSRRQSLPPTPHERNIHSPHQVRDDRRQRSRHSAPAPPRPPHDPQLSHQSAPRSDLRHVERLAPHHEEQQPAHHTTHRFSRPEYDHAPPGSATNQSLWQFGKAKAKSVARGYEAVPRHASTLDISSGQGNQHHGGWFGKMGSPRGAHNHAGPEVDLGESGRGDWREVERNRELEGLTAAKAWGR